MNQNENIMKLEELLRKDAAKREQYIVAQKRIAQNKEAASEAEALVKAAAELGIELNIEEVERSFAEAQLLNDEELEGVAAGGKLDQIADAAENVFGIAGDLMESIGFNNMCWKNYFCLAIYKENLREVMDKALR